MGRKRTLKLKEAPKYPTDDEAKVYASDRRADILGGDDPRTSFLKSEYSDSVTVRATWGINNIYFVFAFPTGGVTIGKPEDILDIPIFEGWILQYVPQSDRFNLLVKAGRDGAVLFWQEHRRYTGK
jgi:hypothetical protein